MKPTAPDHEVKQWFGSSHIIVITQVGPKKYRFKVYELLPLNGNRILEASQIELKDLGKPVIDFEFEGVFRSMQDWSQFYTVFKQVVTDSSVEINRELTKSPMLSPIVMRATEALLLVQDVE